MVPRLALNHVSSHLYRGTVMTSFAFKNKLSEISADLSDFDPLYLPNIKDRSFWDGLPEDYRAERLKLSEEASQKAWPEILMSDYLRFSHDGNRTYYEDKFFTRRRMLTALVMGECIEAKGRFLPKIVDGIYLILGETTWCLPAHNSYIRDTKQFTIPDTSRPVVDLFAGETAAILSVAEALLRPMLKEESPYISTAIDTALYERVLSPYLRFHFWWMGNGLEPMCNWTPWITQNVLLTAFTRPVKKESATVSDLISEEEKAARNVKAEKSDLHETFCSAASVSSNSIISSHDMTSESDDVSLFSNRVMSSQELAKRFSDGTGIADPPDWKTKHLLPSYPELYQIYESAVKSVHHFLSEYDEDGCCDEGAQYYSHAGLCLFGCLSILKSISERSLRLCQKDDSAYRFPDFQQEFSADTEKIRNIATYIMKVHVGGELYINFADCSPKAGRRGAREYLFGAFVSEPSMMTFAAGDYKEETWRERLSPSEENLWYHVLNARCHEEMLELAEGCQEEGASIEVEMSAKLNSESGTAGTGTIKKGDSVSCCSMGSNANNDAWFPSTGLMVTRDRHYVLAAKAGDNADSHNHNDVGSFILYKDSKPFIIDLGVGSYTQKTFSKDRYDIWTMQSQYHNLPSFYDAEGHIIMEHDGEDFRAVNVSCRMDEKSSILSMELQEAYQELDGKLLRSIRFLKSKDFSSASLNFLSAGTDTPDAPVVIKDHYDGRLKFVENIMCYEKPEIVLIQGGAEAAPISDNRKLISLGTLGKLCAIGFSDIRIEELPITDPRLSETWKHSCYRIQLAASGSDVALICY